MIDRLVHIPKFTTDFARIPLANAGARGGALVPVPIDVELLVLEQFPPALRGFFNEATTKLNCLAFVEHFNWCVRHGRDPALTLARAKIIEQNELAVFAGEYRAQYGTPLPYVAAGASPQRYGALGPSRHPPKRYGKPVYRAPRKRRTFRSYLPPVIEVAA